VDWRIYHAIDHHGGVAHAFELLTTICVVLLVVGALVLWVLGRPGVSQWKLAGAAALASGALAYVVNQVVHALHDRARPYEAHAGVSHPYATGTDASFPSDHASAAFGIAWAVFLIDRKIGSIFLSLAAVVGVGRVITGAHYPGDVLAGVVVGLVTAIVVVRLARPLLERLVGLGARLTDPLLRRA
jgi:undecaprenyl-diphosphatase